MAFIVGILLQAIRDSFKQANQDVVFGEHRNFSSTEINVAVAIFAVGGMLGALVGGALADVSYLGRYVYSNGLDEIYTI